MALNKSQEKKFFIYKFLDISIFYNTFQYLIYKKNSKFKIFNSFFDLKNKSVFEIGCGPGINRKFLKANYTGIDVNLKHILKARKKFPRDTFICSDVSNFEFNEIKNFTDIIICHLLHHLNDENVDKLLSNLFKNMKSGQSVHIIDIVFLNDQNPIARLLGKLDKGNYVRFLNKYLDLFNKYNFKFEYQIHSNLLRLPADFIVTKLTK